MGSDSDSESESDSDSEEDEPSLFSGLFWFDVLVSLTVIVVAAAGDLDVGLLEPVPVVDAGFIDCRLRGGCLSDSLSLLLLSDSESESESEEDLGGVGERFRF